MSLLIYVMLVKIYCEIVGSNDELGMFIMLGLIVWLGHCAAKYLFN